MKKVEKIIKKAVKGNKKLTEYEKGYFDGWYETEFKDKAQLKEVQSR